MIHAHTCRRVLSLGKSGDEAKHVVCSKLEVTTDLYAHTKLCQWHCIATPSHEILAWIQSLDS